MVDVTPLPSKPSPSHRHRVAGKTLQKPTSSEPRAQCDHDAYRDEVRRVYAGCSGTCYVMFLVFLTSVVVCCIVAFVYTSNVRPYPGPPIQNKVDVASMPAGVGRHA